MAFKKITEIDVKKCGRYFVEKDIMWISLSATGIEFTCTGTEVTAVLTGDDNSKLTADKVVTHDGKEDPGYVRFGILINDKLASEVMLKPENASADGLFRLSAKCESGDKIRFMKLSESAMSCMGIVGVEVADGVEIKATAPTAKKIEYIGDSITCGYGVDDTEAEHHFETRTENASIAHSFLSSVDAGMDASLCSYSGYGFVSGYTEEDEPLTDLLIPDYYHMIGHSFGKVDGVKIMERDWDFSLFQPDITIINIGTNDESYCRDYADRKALYQERYISFIKTVREKNPKTHFILAYGIMTDMYYPLVAEVAERYSNETGDKNISVFKFTTHSEKDGYGADWHPSKFSQRRAADELAAEIKKWM